MNQPTAQEIFDRRQLRTRRQRARRNFAAHSALFDEANTELLDRLNFIKRPFPHVLTIGNHIQTLAQMLRAQNPARHIIEARTYPGDKNIQRACVVDEEWLPFAPQSFDLILNPLTLHWVNDVPGALLQMRHALKPDGFFMAAMLGGETLWELRACLYEAEMKIRGGISPHISPFATLQDGASLLQRAGFTLPVADKQRLTLTYRNAFALMHELRGMGETNLLHTREKYFMPRNLFTQAAALYAQKFGDEHGRIPATFDVLYLSGWAAHESQQKPLKPGSASLRLADALQGIEKSAGEKVTP